VEALTEIPGIGKAARCTASRSHNPVPLRFVWHHIQPQEAGGATVPANLAELCDSCHYSIHRLMWNMARQLPLGPVPRAAQLAYAQQGYFACVAAGTAGQIPDEG
jgi:HNH endonuclease